jgi:hypothetical protein
MSLEALGFLKIAAREAMLLKRFSKMLHPYKDVTKFYGRGHQCLGEWLRIEWLLSVAPRSLQAPTSSKGY